MFGICNSCQKLSTQRKTLASAEKLLIDTPKKCEGEVASGCHGPLISTGSAKDKPVKSSFGSVLNF